MQSARVQYTLVAAPQHYTSAEDTHVIQSEAAGRVDHSKHTVQDHFAKAAAAPQKPQKLAAKAVGATCSFEDDVYGTILRGAFRLKCFKSSIHGEQQLGQLQREQLTAQPLPYQHACLMLVRKG